MTDDNKAQVECKECHGDRYLLLGCCSGRECGCVGMPVQSTNCKACNADGKAPLNSDNDAFNFVEYVGVEA